MENDIISEWEQIQSPLNEDSNNDDSYVFPPRDHQDLPINTSNENNSHVQSSQPLDSVASSSSDVVRNWRRLLLKLDLRSRIFRVARWVEKCVPCKVFAILASSGVGALLLVYLLRSKVVMWWQRRKKLEGTSKGNDLMVIINQKDKRINKLLFQVAQMNEILLARRRVQVIRIN